jgi:hypothetical protein
MCNCSSETEHVFWFDIILVLWGEFFFLLSISVSSQCPGSEVKPLTEDRGCDSVLLGQSDRTPHGAVADEYEAMVE